MSTALTRLQDEHKQRLQATKAKTIESIFEHAAAVLAFYNDCKKEREWGEATFANRIGEWLDYSRTTGSEWLMIGRNQQKFVVVNDKMPQSMHSLALLAPLPQEDIEECLALKGPDTTQQDIIAFKRALKAPPAKPARPVEEIKADIAKQQATAPAPPLRPEPTPEAPRANRPADMGADETLAEYAARKFEAHDKAFDEFFDSGSARTHLIARQGESPKAYLLQELSELLDSKTGRKLIKQLLSSAYHPDTGKLDQDVQRMSRINEALTKLENY